MMNVRAGAKALMVWAMAVLLQGCGVQRMQLDEQEIKAEWGSILALADREADALEVGKLSNEAVEGARAALRLEMSKWQSIPTREDLQAGARAVHEVEKAVDALIGNSEWLKKEGASTAAATIRELRKKSEMVRLRYDVAVATYNDILELYPAKIMASVMGQEKAVAFTEPDRLGGQIGESGMLKRLGAGGENRSK